MLPSAVVAGVASLAFILSGCSEAHPTAPVTEKMPASPVPGDATRNPQTAAPHHESTNKATSGETQNEGQNDKDGHSQATSGSTQGSSQGSGTRNGNGGTSGHQNTIKPTKTAQALKPLHFEVTGTCADEELENDSYNFTRYGETRNTIMQPDGTAYPGLIDNGYGHADGLGHSQWHWLCEDKDQKGTYTGVIRDLGEDGVINTADDRTATYSFVVS